MNNFGALKGLEIWFEIPSTFAWREASKVHLIFEHGSAFLVSEIVPLGYWDEAAGTDETSQLLLEGFDMLPTLGGEPVFETFESGGVLSAREIFEGKRRIGLELLRDETLFGGFYTNFGSYYVNFSFDPTICYEVKKNLQIERNDPG